MTTSGGIGGLPPAPAVLLGCSCCGGNDVGGGGELSQMFSATWEQSTSEVQAGAVNTPMMAPQSIPIATTVDMGLTLSISLPQVLYFLEGYEGLLSIQSELNVVDDMALGLFGQQWQDIFPFPLQENGAPSDFWHPQPYTFVTGALVPAGTSGEIVVGWNHNANDDGGDRLYSAFAQGSIVATATLVPV